MATEDRVYPPADYSVDPENHWVVDENGLNTGPQYVRRLVGFPSGSTGVGLPCATRHTPMPKLLDGREAWKTLEDQCCVSGVFECHKEDNQTLQNHQKGLANITENKYTKSKALEPWGYEGYV